MYVYLHVPANERIIQTNAHIYVELPKFQFRNQVLFIESNCFWLWKNITAWKICQFSIFSQRFPNLWKKIFFLLVIKIRAGILVQSRFPRRLQNLTKLNFKSTGRQSLAAFLKFRYSVKAIKIWKNLPLCFDILTLQLNKYQTDLYLLELSHQMTNVCLLISDFLPIFDWSCLLGT